INKFESGFIAGVKSVNPEAAKGLIGTKDKAGAMVKYADSFTDTNKGYELGKSLYGAGCDIVYHAAGGVGIGLFKSAKELNKADKRIWAIGVDRDQAAEMTEYADIILSSMVKRVDTATFNATKEVVDGTFKGGKHIELGLKEDGVGIAPSSNKNTSKETLELVEKYSKAVKEGKIKVPATREELVKFTPTEIK
ncbi:BMP family ABC transporter substrate-binding protein, partial [Clostridium sp.]|uniref:BMP family lipoprotein n=1 Tax=Clostridium sp. TaxID=1506 RepID=UPI00257A77B5